MGRQAVSTFDEANTVAALIGARRQSWSWLRDDSSLAAITSPNGPPTGAGSVALIQRIRGSLIVACRLDASTREALITVGTYTTADDYSLHLGYLTVVSGTAHSTAAELLIALRDAVLALSGAPYLAEIVGDALRVRGVSSEDYSISWSAPTTGTLEIVADAVGGDVCVWAQPDGENDSPDGPRRWARLEEVEALDRRGRLVELRTPARRTAYLEAVRIDRHDSDGLDVVPRLIVGFGIGAN